MENKEIQLTPAEIEMIKVKREQEELKAKEEALKKQAKIEKEIEVCKKRIDEYKKNCETQRYHATLFKEEFDKIAPGQYSLIKVPEKETFEVKDYLGDSKYETHFQEVIEDEHYEIKHSESGEKMKVKFHVVYDNSTWGSSPKSKYWALEYGWRKFYKVAKTVHTKIEEKLAKKRREEREKIMKATAKETVLAELTKRYPGTKIEHKEEYHSTYNGRGYRKSYDRSWTTYHYVVTFERGLQIKFKYYEDGNIGEGSVVNLHQFDFEQVVNFLRQYPLKEKK